MEREASVKKELLTAIKSGLAGAIALSILSCSSSNLFNATPNNSSASFGTYRVATGTSSNDVNSVHFKASQYDRFGVIPHEIIVKYRQSLKAFNPDNFLQPYNLKVVKVIPSLNIQIVQTEMGGNGETNGSKELVKKLMESPEVEYAEQNFIVKTTYKPNDTMFSKQYAPQIVKAPEAWDITAGDKSVVLSIVDTGIDLKHPDLAGKILKGYDVVDKDNEPMDGQGHGTHCAGIAAAITNNSEGIAGIAPKCSILPVRVLDDNGSGSNSDVAEGIVWAAEHGANVISMSLGGKQKSNAVEDAVKLAISKNIIVIAAMGNDGQEIKCYPGALPGVVAVGSTDNKDKRSSFSNFGEWISVCAPGSNILSTFPTYDTSMGQKNYGSISGTSMATPAVAGLAALIKSKNWGYSITDIRKALERGSDDIGTSGFDKEFGHGRINALNSLKK